MDPMQLLCSVAGLLLNMQYASTISVCPAFVFNQDCHGMAYGGLLRGALLLLSNPSS